MSSAIVASGITSWLPEQSVSQDTLYVNSFSLFQSSEEKSCPVSHPVYLHGSQSDQLLHSCNMYVLVYASWIFFDLFFIILITSFHIPLTVSASLINLGKF